MLFSWSLRSFLLNDQFLFIEAHCTKGGSGKSSFDCACTWSLSCAINCIFNARGIANSLLRTWLGCVFLPNWPEAMHLAPTCGNKRNNIPPSSPSRFSLDDRFSMRPLHTPRFSLLAALARASECTATYAIIRRFYTPTIRNAQIRFFLYTRVFFNMEL